MDVDAIDIDDAHITENVLFSQTQFNCNTRYYNGEAWHSTFLSLHTSRIGNYIYKYIYM